MTKTLLLSIAINVELTLILILMSEEQLKAFWEAIQTDPALQQKLKDVTDFDASCGNRQGSRLFN